MVKKHSDKLLCSSNNYSSLGFTFNSFGDSNGTRKDFFRFFKLTQKSINNASTFNKLNETYNSILDELNKNFAYESGVLINNAMLKTIKYINLSETEKNIADFLNELDYITINKENIIIVNIPVFYEVELSTIIKELSDLILLDIFPLVKEIFDNFKNTAPYLSSIKHNVNIKEIANEIWHQIFGSTNEYLVNQGFVSTPNEIEGQGRYLRSIIIPDI